MHVYGLDIRQNELHYNLIGKNSKMDVLHKSTASWANATESETETEGPEASTSRAPTEEFRRPQPKRSASRASDSSVASSFRKEYGGASAESRHTSAFDVDETPMDPPARASSPSRRSSVSSAHASPSANHTRVARSPSPMPPLPAIRVPAASTSSNTLHVKSLHQQEEQQRFTTHLYGDQEASPFFRRLAWSPDGALLLTPAGIFDDPFAVGPGSEATSSKPKKKSSKKGSLGPKPTVYIYSRANIGRPPVAHLPGHKSASIAIRFNPVLWELRTEEAAKSNPAKTVRVDLEVGVETSVEMGSASAAVKGKALKGAFDLPHRMIYAIATHESVYVYDTQQAGPLCMFGNLHYAPFTDVTWYGAALLLDSLRGLSCTGARTVRRWFSPTRTATARSWRSKRASWARLCPTSRLAFRPSSLTLRLRPPLHHHQSLQPRLRLRSPRSRPRRSSLRRTAASRSRRSDASS
jgi:chromatin assembly factor 1 subunit B